MQNVTKNDVEMAYRLILGREPENSEVVARYMADFSISELRLKFLHSEEFTRQFLKHRIDLGEGSENTTSSTASGRDVLLKHIDLSPQRSIKLALPIVSTDPIAIEYQSGLTSNDYMLDVLLKLTRPKDKVIDLGAHLGTFSVPAAALGRHVLSIDASRMHVDLLEISKAVNGLSDLYPVWAAVAKEPGHVPFVHTGLFGHIDFSGTDKSSVPVPAKTLRTIVSENSYENVAFVKADIEGSERLALESISDLLESANGPAILYESNNGTFANAGYSVVDMRRWLEAKGYKSFRIEGNRWIYAGPDQPQPELWVDILALKKRHQESFNSSIDFHWSNDLMIKKILEWGTLPHANVRVHLAKVLADYRSLRETPELSNLWNKLKSEL